MPIYEYLCETCGAVFERLRKSQDADQPAGCPRCESQESRRQLSSFAQGGAQGGACAPAGSRFR